MSYGTISTGDVAPGDVGPQIHDINIYQGAGNGFINGIILNNSWHSHVTAIYGFGNETTYDTGSGAGSGALISYTNRSVNHVISDIQSDFWYSSLSITCPQSGGPTGPNTIQGFQISNCNFVQSPYAINIVGYSATDSGAINVNNIQVDNGNVSGQSHVLLNAHLAPRRIEGRASARRADAGNTAQLSTT